MGALVWTYTSDYPLEISIEEDEQVFTPEAGYDVFLSRTTEHYGEDGTGNETSWAGRFVIKLRLARKDYAAVRWLKARKDADEAFFFYLPHVTPTPDPTGNTVAGRILVKVFGPIESTLTHLNQFAFQATLKQVFNCGVGTT